MRPATSRTAIGAVALAGLTGALLVGPSTAAAAPPAPSKLGIRASVPLGAKAVTVDPGQQISVRVGRSRVRGDRVVRVSLARAAESGRVLRGLSSRRARHGRVVVRIPTEDGARFRLAVRTGPHRYQVTLRTPAATPPAPSLPVPPPPISSCWSPQASPDQGVATASLVLERTVVAAGEMAPARLSNTSEGAQCLRSDWGQVRWERLVDGRWVGPPPYPAGTNPPAMTLEIWGLAPGQSKSVGQVVPAHFPSGRYRYVVDLTVGQPPTTVTATAELEVTGTPG